MPKSISLSFSHVGFFVSDMQRMKGFYTDVLGFFITDEGDFPNGQSLVFLSRDPNEHHQLVLVSGRPAGNGFNPINQISFLVTDLQALKDFYKLAQDKVLDDLQAVTHGNAWSIYFRDPEGNRLEVYTHTPWYVNQPLREPLDLSLSIEDIHDKTLALCKTLPGFTSRNNWCDSMTSLMQTE